ncbi:GNAT family N-acetyltransferase [Chitinimonas lacunae]|uniref:GNAT family N-acetyltransferase n=1 Tax=Chitinimonas lacunae TaxID=1963018 RepID=A0ABV8ML80_9NEIS
MEGLDLHLRPWRVSDLEEMARWHVSGATWRRFDAPYLPPASAAAMVEQVRAWLLRPPAVAESLVVADSDSDRLLGRVWRYWQCRDSRWLSTGVVLYDPTYWHRGLGYQALGLWCEHLFTVMTDLRRLDLRTWSGNPAMMRLAARLGFVEEGRFRRAREVDGVHYDALAYGVLREEWRSRYPAGFAQALTRRVPDSTVLAAP